MADSELQVKLTADSRDFDRATAQASKGLDELRKDVERLDSEQIEITPDIDLARVNRDLASLRRALDHIEAAKLSPDVDLDPSKLLAQERRIRRELDALDARRVEIEVGLQGDEQVESDLLGLGKKLGGLVAAGEVGRWLLDGATGAAQFEGAMRALNTVLGDTTATGLEGWVEDNADALNLTQTAAAEAMRSLSLYAGAAQDAGADSEKFITDLIRIGSEAAAFTGQDAASAVDAIGSAMRGEFDTLEQYGINLTQARLDAEAAALGLGDTHSELSQGEKAWVTYNALLEESAPLMGSVDRNADLLTGKFADLQQSTGDLADSLGSALEPSLSTLVDLLDASVDGAKGLADQIPAAVDWADTYLDPGKWAPMLFGIETSASRAGDAGKKAGEDTAAGLSEAEQKAADLEAQLAKAAETLRTLGEDTRVTVDFLINADDMREEIRAAIGKGVELPANLTLGKIAGLSDRQQELVGNISSFVEAGLEEAGRRAQLFGPEAGARFAADLRRQTRGLLISAGIDSEKVDRVLARIFGLPRTIDVEANTGAAEKDIAALTKPRKSTITPRMADEWARRDLADLTKDRTTTITANVHDQEAQQTINRLEQDGYKNIYVRVINQGRPTGGGVIPQSMAVQSAPAAGPARLAATPTAQVADPWYSPTAQASARAGTSTGGGVAGIPAGDRTTMLAPRQTPIRVYVDGDEVATKVVPRAQALAAVGIVNRRP